MDRLDHARHLTDADSNDSFSISSDPEKKTYWTRKKKIGIALGCTALVMGIVVAVAVSQVNKPRASSQQLDADYCNHFIGDAKQYCNKYYASQGALKFTAAADWRHYSPASYDCSGVTADCLTADLESNVSGTSCKAVAEGAACSENETCNSGFCGGPPLLSNSIGAASRTAAPELAPLSAGNRADEAFASPSMPQARSTSMSAGPNASWPTAIASVWPSNMGIKVPDAFLATSHEWRRIQDYGGVNLDAWAEIFKLLGPSPVLRVGGASQDAMTAVPGEEVWESLRRLQKAINCRFIIGLPLWQKNALEMSRKIMADAQEYLGDSLMGFELGNEPEFWPTGLGGYDEKGQWQSGFEAFAAYYHRVATALNPCTGGKPNLSGPGWGNVNTQDPSWFAKIVSQGKCYMWESNVHYYPYINNETVTAPELLSQWLQDFALDKFKVYSGMAKRFGLPIRISETNSMYGGGRVGLSDTMVGTFWTVDALFAFANVGATAFHLHWGKGGDPSGDNPPSVGVQTNFILKNGEPPYPYPSVHAPWYGYLFWTVATAGGHGKAVDSNFVTANVERWNDCTANIKVYGLKSYRNGEVRIALVNKDIDKSCNVDVRIEQKFCSDKAGLSRLLPGPPGIFSKGRITWRGQHYMNSGTTGKLQGEVEVVQVKPQMYADKPCSYKIALPAASAALLVVTPEKALT